MGDESSIDLHGDKIYRLGGIVGDTGKKLIEKLDGFTDVEEKNIPDGGGE